MKKLLLIVAATSTVLLAQNHSSAVMQGNKAAKELMQTLGSNLKKTLKSQGLIAAAKFCNANAASLTQEVNQKLGTSVSVQRITLKARNAANQASGQDKDILQGYARLNKLGEHLPNYTLIDNGGAQLTMYKPMVINKGVCLKCHGTIDTKSELGAFLSTHYPNDTATGYKMGDLRGAMKVTIPR